MDLCIDKWKPFITSKLFPVMENGKANQQMLSDGDDCIYVGAKRSSNGVMRTCAFDEQLITKGNCVIFICNGDGSVGYANYMGEDFIGTTDIVAGYNDDLNPFTGMFLSMVYSKERFKYSFGRKWKQNLGKTIVMLPAVYSNDGTVLIDKDSKYSDEGYIPDWVWIEKFMKSLEAGLDEQMNDIMSIADGDKSIVEMFADKVDINDFKDWLKDNANMNNDNQISLKETNWDYFKVGELFDIHPTKIYKDMNSTSLNDGGDTQFIVNSAVNNGIGGFSTLEPTESGKIITYSDTTEGNTFFYQKDPFIGFPHIQGMYPKGFELNTERALFLIGIFTFAIKGLYDYNRKFRRDKFMLTKVYLPIDSNGHINWDWIERYIKSLPYSDRV